LLEWRPYYRYPIKFCVIRNPFARMLSQFSWSQGGSCPTSNEALRLRDERIQRDLRLATPKRPNYADCHFVPQAWYVADHIGQEWLAEVSHFGIWLRLILLVLLM